MINLKRQRREERGGRGKQRKSGRNGERLRSEGFVTDEWGKLLGVAAEGEGLCREMKGAEVKKHINTLCFISGRLQPCSTSDRRKQTEPFICGQNCRDQMCKAVNPGLRSVFCLNG